MYDMGFEILRDFTDYRDYMGLSSMVRLCKWSLLSLISYNLGGSVTPSKPEATTGGLATVPLVLSYGLKNVAASYASSVSTSLSVYTDLLGHHLRCSLDLIATLKEHLGP